MVDSKQLLKRAGISRATLNNYIALGLLPKPVVRPGGSEESRIPRLGYFPNSALEIINRVNVLKKRGYAMKEIVSIIDQGTGNGEDNAEFNGIDRRTKVEDRRKTIDTVQPEFVGNGLRLTLDQVEHPAYLVNSLFELEWANPQAQDKIIGRANGLSIDITERNLFSSLLMGDTVSKADSLEELLKFHVSIAKNRLSKSALLTLDPELTDEHVDTLSRLYDETEKTSVGQILHIQANLAARDEEESWYDIYASFFREGIFFVYSPASTEAESLMQLLSRRDVVIRDLLKKRRPYLTPLAVLVADLQDSVKICAELPPEEYFELINDIWGAMEPHLRKYYATHGKHVGDGMVYYFFPQPDCNYVLNAVRCAQDMKEIIADISRTWRKRKNWMNDLQLNFGLVEGQEWFGSYQTPTHLEFTVLGDTINMAGRLSDFAREGSIWITKSMLGKLTSKERDTVRYGVRRKSETGDDILIPNTYSRVNNLIDLDNAKNLKFKDIAVLPITEVLDVERGDKEVSDEA